jgi:hypothetical protein
MSKQIGYQQTHQMEAREGTRFATVYYKQTLAQRKELVNHIYRVLSEIAEVTDQHPEYTDWFYEPQKMYPKITGTKKREYRTIMEMFEDIIGECRGAKRDGTPKDFARAPIDRWNKLFYDTDYAIDMVESYQDKITTFDSMFKVK